MGVRNSFNAIIIILFYIMKCCNKSIEKCLYVHCIQRIVRIPAVAPTSITNQTDAKSASYPAKNPRFTVNIYLINTDTYI